MRSTTIAVRTGGRAEVHDLTGDCAEFIRTEGDGLLNVFVPHATAGVAIMETGAGSDHDLITALDELLPRDGRWAHAHGSPGHGRDHVLPAFIVDKRFDCHQRPAGRQCIVCRADQMHFVFEIPIVQDHAHRDQVRLRQRLLEKIARCRGDTRLQPRRAD